MFISSDNIVGFVAILIDVMNIHNNNKHNHDASVAETGSDMFAFPIITTILHTDVINPAVISTSAPSSLSTASLLTDQSLVVNEVVAHEGLDGLVRGGAAGCGAIHGDEHEGHSSDEDEGSLHVVALGKFKFNSNSNVN